MKRRYPAAVIVSLVVLTSVGLVTCAADRDKTSAEFRNQFIKEFLDTIQNSPDYDTVIIRASTEKRDGMSISYKIR